MTADLDPKKDSGANDRITNIIDPEFTIAAPQLLSAGDTAMLIDPKGNKVGSVLVTPADVNSGKVNVPTGELDDGVYTFTAQIRNPDGSLKGEAPVVVTIVTDRDGVQPSVEKAANNGDFNKDGVEDWEQNNVAQLPMKTLADFIAGKNAPASSFGAIIAGDVPATAPGAAVKLNDSAQLLDISLRAKPAPLPTTITESTPVFDFSVTSESGKTLVDAAPTVPGLQARIVIELPAGVKANTYQKFVASSGKWISFVDDGRLDTYDDGATLLDTNGDGLIDRVVVTVTDGGPGDEDGLVNGVIVDPGLLGFEQKAKPVYSVLLATGDRYYSADPAEAAKMAAGGANVFEGVRFDNLSTDAGGRQIFANKNFITGDWYFAAEGQPMPYSCYIRQPDSGYQAAAAGSGKGEDFYLYLNATGLTQLVTKAEASQLGLVSKGYTEYGAIFNTTTTTAFVFDPEGYLVANQSNTSFRSFVAKLAQQYQRVSDPGFIDAVEAHYFTQIGVVGVSSGTASTAADLNAAFGTGFQA